eukprot:CAMPEP_0115197188 /NCGR_PEP_ID=MMETSP0270-20121206/15469_1 /TAXON_ID=71861 /ORGANISM="Scrippsiella trochoidea, Strain CCMP3099" /LENGTH=141 /DNA_ID=CAMNT_0002610537 /DNA_START=265 /DNA_END=691 /DNA_ORIENTATION=-
MVECSLPGSWDLQIESVVAGHIIADVCDLDDHALAHQLGGRATPIAVAVLLVDELKLEALATIFVPCEAVGPIGAAAAKPIARFALWMRGCMLGQAAAKPPSQTEGSFALTTPPPSALQDVMGLLTLPLPGQPQLGLQQSQ